jgi:hypothetical protein
MGKSFFLQSPSPFFPSPSPSPRLSLALPPFSPPLSPPLSSPHTSLSHTFADQKTGCRSNSNECSGKNRTCIASSETTSTKPHTCARWASMRRPVKIRSFVREVPISRLALWVPAPTSPFQFLCHTLFNFFVIHLSFHCHPFFFSVVMPLLFPRPVIPLAFSFI